MTDTVGFDEPPAPAGGRGRLRGILSRPYGLPRTPRNRVSSSWTCMLSFRTSSIPNVPNALSSGIPGRLKQASQPSLMVKD